MNDLVERFVVEDGLYIYLQRNSKVWLARFKIDGKWMSRTTKQRDKSKAINGERQARITSSLRRPKKDHFPRRKSSLSLWRNARSRLAQRLE